MKELYLPLWGVINTTVRTYSKSFRPGCARRVYKAARREGLYLLPGHVAAERLTEMLKAELIAQ